MRYLLSIVLATLLACPALAQEKAKPGFEKWEKEIAAMEARDAKAKPAKGGVLFLGSSSIRLWDLKKSFPELEAVNHGFGGSTIADSVHFVDRLVFPLEPKTIVFYAGDNDLAQGKSPEQVHEDFQSLVKAVHAKLPETRIIYLPVKPSPSRVKLLEKQKQANGLIRETIEQDPKRLVYLDLFTPMLDSSGQPREELFRDDKLHLNDAGYALWAEKLAPVLSK